MKCVWVCFACFKWYFSIVHNVPDAFSHVTPLHRHTHLYRKKTHIGRVQRKLHYYQQFIILYTTIYSNIRIQSSLNERAITIRLMQSLISLLFFPPFTRESINLAILTLIETGEMTKLQNKWWFDDAECKRTHTQDAMHRNELSLNDVAGIFFILIGGLLVALVVAIIEFCIKSNGRKYSSDASDAPMNNSDGSHSCSSTLASAGANASDDTNMIIIGDGGGGSGGRGDVAIVRHCHSGNTSTGNSTYGSSFIGAMGCGTTGSSINNSKHISDSMKSKLTTPSASGDGGGGGGGNSSDSSICGTIRNYDDNGRVGVSIYLMVRVHLQNLQWNAIGF